MRNVGVIAEFNPFHSGHEYLLNKIRQAGAESIIVAMSGNFVQRGEPSIIDAGTRARIAVECGADLVLQLPVPYAMAGAGVFARGGVSLLNSTGVVDTLAFGSECGNTELIAKTASAVKDENVNSEICRRLSAGIPYAQARQEAVAAYFPDCAEILANPNDILGVEYINALCELCRDVTPFAVPRRGVRHDGGSDGSFASASALRDIILSGELQDCCRYMPEKAFDVLKERTGSEKSFGNLNEISNAVLYKMRTLTADEASLLPDISEGIENRIIACAGQAQSLESLYDLVKTKRYSHARIRRIVMSAFLGIHADDSAAGVPYIRVLAFGNKGRELLKAMQTTAASPVIMRHSDAGKLTERAKRMYDLECRASDIYGLCFNPALPSGAEQRLNAQYVECI